jgi:hypothetical protein
MVWPRQSLSWSHDNDLDPYPNLPGRLRPIGISWLSALMQLVFDRALNDKVRETRVDCVSKKPDRGGRGRVSCQRINADAGAFCVRTTDVDSTRDRIGCSWNINLKKRVQAQRLSPA